MEITGKLTINSFLHLYRKFVCWTLILKYYDIISKIRSNHFRFIYKLHTFDTVKIPGLKNGLKQQRKENEFN